MIGDSVTASVAILKTVFEKVAGPDSQNTAVEGFVEVFLVAEQILAQLWMDRDVAVDDIFRFLASHLFCISP